MFCASESIGKCSGFIYSHRADWVLAVHHKLPPHVCFWMYIYQPLCPTRHVGLPRVQPALQHPTLGEQWAAIEIVHLPTLIAQTYWRGPYSTQGQTNKCNLHHFSNPSLCTSCLDQNKAGHFGRLNQAGSASQIRRSSESLRDLCKCERVSPDVQSSFFFW